MDEEVAFSLGTEICECEYYQFCDPYHKHIITRDLRIIYNFKLRKLMTKDPNYKEPHILL